MRVVALAGSPAWLTDHVLGDHYVFGTSSPGRGGWSPVDIRSG